MDTWNTQFDEAMALVNDGQMETSNSSFHHFLNDWREKKRRASFNNLKFTFLVTQSLKGWYQLKWLLISILFLATHVKRAFAPVVGDGGRRRLGAQQTDVRTCIATLATARSIMVASTATGGGRAVVMLVCETETEKNFVHLIFC